MMQFALLGLTAETSLHAGTGRRTGVIDLPIMREAHTGWPCIYGSAVKGAYRSHAERLGGMRPDDVLDVFGPETTSASEHAGALAVGDARLLLLPVRSLNSHFKWITCPALLRRVADDAKRLGVDGAVDYQGEAPQDDQAISHQDGGTAEALFLEEFSFTVTRKDLSSLIAWLARFSANEHFAQQLKAQLVIVSDDMFHHLATYATPVTAHIAIESARKVVKNGALWYEETLPPETVLYVPLAASPSRRPSDDGTRHAVWVLQQALGLFPLNRPYVQMGGNETVGMGWCRVHTVASSLQET